ncbi:MAG TPA: hypothetical protein PLI19_05725, partial [Erysipelotrichaceae bacterium]|nr:hypothetical protein [Erysipelotrichaceae bacterium]
VQKDGDAPVSTGGFTPVHDGEYVEATNSYDDGDPTYYLATHDPFKAGLTEITYNGVVYPLAGVALVSEDFNYHTQTASDGARIFAYDGPSNITIFFDDGRYNDTVATNYTAFSRTNNSYIGLNKDGNGESMVTISRNPRFIILFGNLMERYLLNNKNL